MKILLDKDKKHQKEILKFRGEKWNFTKERLLTNSKVYKSIDGSKYLHIGNNKNIKKEISYSKKLHKLGFPIPDLLEYDKIKNYSYYIERSAGKKSFGDKFCEEYKLQSQVSSNTLELLCDTICIFLSSQIKYSNRFNQKYDLRKNIMLLNVLKENPDLDVNKIEMCVSKIENRLHPLPATFSHGDLTPRNIFETGIIDLEFSSIMPIGYDVLTVPIMERFWSFKKNNNKTYEDFSLNEEQISHYFERIETEAKKNGIKDFLTFTDDFILLKSIWSLAHEKYSAIQSGNTLKWNFRKGILVYCMEQYLNGKPIETKKFKMLNVV